MSLVDDGSIDDFLEPARRSLQTLPRRGFNGKAEAYSETFFEAETVQEQTRRVIEDLCRISEEAQVALSKRRVTRVSAEKASIIGKKRIRDC